MKHPSAYTQVKNFLKKEKVIDVKNEVKCNILGKNDGVTLRTDLGSKGKICF